MNSELKKPNSFKLLLEEHEEDFFRIPEMTQHVRFFATRSQSKAQIVQDRITRSLRTYQSTGDMVDTFFSGMLGTVIGMTGGSTPPRGRRHLPPDGGSF
jgi:hypothetical protein